METIIPFVLLAVVFYLLIIRPMQSRQKQMSALRTMHEALTPGTRVMLTSGIHGTVMSVDEDTIVLQIAPGTDITVAKAAVAVVDNDDAEPEA